MVICWRTGDRYRARFLRGSGGAGVAPGRRLALAAIFSGALQLGGCDTSVDEPALAPVESGTVVIGMLLPVTSGVGVQMEQSARLAVAQINAAGGVNGQRIALRISYDGNNNAATGLREARALVDSGIVALIGANASRVTMPIADQITVPAGIALISPGSTSPLISSLIDNDTVYRVPPSDALQGRLLAEKVFGEGRTQVAIFAGDDPYGRGLADVFTARFTALGGTVQATALVPAGKESGFATEIDALYAPGTPPALMLFHFSNITSTVLRELITAKGALPVLYGVDANMGPGTASNSPAQINGMRGTNPTGAPNSTPAAQRYLQAFRAATGEDAVEGRSHYDAVYLIALAMAQAGANTPAAVVANLRAVSRPDTATPTTILPGEFAQALAAIAAGEDMDYQGAAGNIDFDAAGDPTAATYEYREIRVTGAGVDVVTLETIAYP